MRTPKAVLAASAAVVVGFGVGLAVPALATGNSVVPAVHQAPESSFPHMNHVFVFMMENSSYNDLLSATNRNTTFIQQMAKQYGLATYYYGVTHTSLPNYVAALSGSNWGSNTDDEAQADDGYFNHTNLVDELQQAGVSWRGYMQSMPSVGYTGDYGDCTSPAPDPNCTSDPTSSAMYVRKHNPFMQFPDIYNNPQLADNVVPLKELGDALKTGDVAAFNWISPNICNDMHGGAPACPYPSSPTDPLQARLYQDGNNFLKLWVNAIMSSPAWTGNSAIFITWDESDYSDSSPYGPEDDSGCCDSPILPATPVNPTTGSGGDLVGGTLYGGGHVPMIVISREGARGTADATPSNHYSLLRTIELNWGLPFIGFASDKAQVHSLAPLLMPPGATSKTH